MNEICHNTDGSFYCDCEIGYQEKGSEDCPDENHRQTLNFESLISQPNHQLYLAW